MQGRFNPEHYEVEILDSAINTFFITFIRGWKWKLKQNKIQYTKLEEKGKLFQESVGTYS